ncbi:putative uncharacterized protein DDB_G0282133 [Chelonus insularis]|uniref:putative uncharacterized protein DDB_G0282133 n=1 Tax=Chelonus insularis TaxID=460826 RepID=UPI00158BF3A4|nr:putative uncharacterized protein DDB_G0282133 [Chelonus insularis]
MEEPFKDTGDSNNESPVNRRTDETIEGVITTDEKDVRILSVDKLTVEKIVLEKAGSQEVLFTKSESSKKLSESTKTFPTKINFNKLQDFKNKKDLTNSNFNEDLKCSGKSTEELKNADNCKKKISFSKLPVWRSPKIKSPNIGNEIRTKSVKFDKSLVEESQLNSHSSILNPLKICKVSPTISPEPLKKIKANTNKKGSASGEDFNNQADLTNNSQKLIQDILIEDVRDNKTEPVIQKCREITQKTHNEIEKLQKNLVKVNSATIESFKQKLPILHPHVLKTSTSPDLDLNENITRVVFDKNLLPQHDFNKNFKVEDKTLLETDFDYAPDGEKLNYSKFNKPKYSREVSEVEKRWSGEFLENQFENSSGSSKSSYIEEIGSISSHGSFIEDSHANSNQRSELHVRKKNEDLKKSEIDEILEDTVSTVDSTSCLEDRIKAIDEDINQSIKLEKNHDESESRDSTLKKSSSTDTCYQIEEVQVNIETNKKQSNDCEKIELKRVFINEETEEEDCETDDQSNFIDEERECTEVERVIVTEKEGECMQSDGYAELIKEITMDPGSSKSKDEKKKKGGLRRLLPGLFSPKDSRKDYKKEQKERKKRDERHFSQYQQNGIYTRSPDTMHLNEDIRRNVNLDTSLNGTIIEERLNEIKQELFPEPGMTTSTPDHFIQNDRNHMQGQRAPKIYTANSSLSSIAVEDKWIDQNIISGSPDMRKLKAHIRNDNESKCSLERKHSLQESQPRFLRNHGPSGRISAPPSERYLIRPRAVHPIDRPLPAIPQKVEYVNYENHPEIHQVPNNYTGQEVTNYQMGGYYPNNQNYANEAELFENGNHIEKAEVNKNYSIDSGFNLTPVSGQMKMNRNHVINQNNNMNNNNGQKTPSNHGRSPKYSPSSSQKSGDYADSSYTPNSSQKSEFSPGSSKSGEYYLNSPRTSSRMSPDDNFNDQRDEIDHEPMKNGNYQVPSSIRVQNKDEHVYDETPRSPFEEDKSSGISKVQNNNPEAVYGQRGSPNIPLSSNLAKLRANVENSSRSESPRNFDGRAGQSSQIPSPVASSKVSTLSIQSPSQRDLAKSPLSNAPRVTSPLTVVTPVSPTTCINTMSPNGINRSRSATPSGSMSPARILTLSQETSRLTISPSTINQVTSNSMSTFQPRKAQPTDQILIASPKRELIYDTQPHRPPSRLEAGCPDSPVPMADSPCRISSPRPNFRQNIAELDRAKSPIMEMCEHPPPQAFQDQPQRIPMQSNRPMSPRISEKIPEKGIQRPEPIYCTRSPQRAISPLAIKSDQRTTSLAGGKANMLLIPARPDNVNSISLSPSKLLENLAAKNLQGVNSTQEQHRVQSPKPMSPQVHKELINSSPEQAEKLQLRKKDSNYYHERPQAIYDEQNNLIREKNTVNEPIYVKRVQPSPVPDHMMTPIYQHPQKHQVVSQQHQGARLEQPRQQIYVTKQEICGPNQEPIYGRQSMPEGNIQRNQNQEKIYGQTVTEPIYGQNKQLSPSKKQMMQHLEAFYWQQKALEAQKNSGNSPNKCQEISVPNPEVREAIYWQQLKKLDEEQQRKIYERNQFDEKSDPIYWKKKIQSSSPSPTTQVMKQNSPSLSSPNRSQVQAQIEHHSESCEQIYWRNKSSPVVNPSGKPPLAGQKGQNQPVLVVRPQQAVRESNQVQFIEQESKDSSKSKNLSPYFVRNDERRSLQIPRKSGSTLDDTRKSSTSSIYDDTDIDKKQPPPIFKRGSLISNSSSSVEYNTMGPKRVSFSNQSNSPEIGSGNWPTKHGMAPEPPTRKHRTEEKILPEAGVQNPRFHAEDQNNINIYGNVSVCSLQQQQQQHIYDIDYDANKPLPPLPSKDPWMLKRSNSMKDARNQQFEVQRLVQVNPRKLSGFSESESGSEAGEVQKILQRRHGEFLIKSILPNMCILIHLHSS